VAAERLAADGLAVVVSYAGNPAPAEEAVRAIEQAGGTALAVKADVADEAEVAALFDPADDGAETVNRVGDLVRTAFYQRIGLEDLLGPHLD
jgi:NAD(P)-dependent dehydrogenase (short-subunit alcohol dehydrogenase family)